MSGKEKMLLKLMCALVLCALCLPALAEEVDYIYYEWNNGLIRHDDGICTTATVIADNEKTLSTGWYVAEGGVSFLSRPTVSGNIHLILMDSFKLTVSYGIGISCAGSSPTIYAQSEGSNIDDMEANVVDSEDSVITTHKLFNVRSTFSCGKFEKITC